MRCARFFTRLIQVTVPAFFMLWKICILDHNECAPRSERSNLAHLFRTLVHRTGFWLLSHPILRRRMSEGCSHLPKLQRYPRIKRCILAADLVLKRPGEKSELPRIKPTARKLGENLLK